jgi:hypothetical protein
VRVEEEKESRIVGICGEEQNNDSVNADSLFILWDSDLAE